MSYFKQRTFFSRSVHWLLLGFFFVDTLGMSVFPSGRAEAATVPVLTEAPALPRAVYQNLPLIQGVRLLSDRSSALELIVSSDAHATFSNEEMKKAIKYFCAFLAIPEEEIWVNLAPAEHEKIVPVSLGRTLAGKDLLSADYLLKQWAAALTDPDSRLGKIFWEKVYAQAMQRYGTTDIPFSVSNKVWITPERVVIYEKSNAAVIAHSTLMVVLDLDHSQPGSGQLSDAIYRELMIPVLTKEVNEGEEFKPLRQLFHALILAQWFKQRLRQNVIAEVYGDSRKLKGISDVDRPEIEAIYTHYIAAYQRGAYHLIREEDDAGTGGVVQRKYFSGGFEGGHFADYARMRPVADGPPGIVSMAERITREPLTRVVFELSPLRTGDIPGHMKMGDWAQKTFGQKTLVRSMGLALALSIGGMSFGLNVQEPNVASFANGRAVSMQVEKVKGNTIEIQHPVKLPARLTQSVSGSVEGVHSGWPFDWGASNSTRYNFLIPPGKTGFLLMDGAFQVPIVAVPEMPASKGIQEWWSLSRFEWLGFLLAALGPVNMVLKKSYSVFNSFRQLERNELDKEKDFLKFLTMFLKADKTCPFSYKPGQRPIQARYWKLDAVIAKHIGDQLKITFLATTQMQGQELGNGGLLKEFENVFHSGDVMLLSGGEALTIARIVVEGKGIILYFQKTDGTPLDRTAEIEIRYRNKDGENGLEKMNLSAEVNSLDSLRDIWAATLADKDLNSANLSVLIGKINKFRRFHPFSIDVAPGHARIYYKIKQMSDETYWRCVSQENIPKEQREYFAVLSRYAHLARNIAGHAATMDSYKSYFFEENDAVFQYKIPKVVKLGVKNFYFAQKSFDVSRVRIQVVFNEFAALNNRLNVFEKGVGGQDLGRISPNDLNRNLEVYSASLRKPMDNSIEGSDLVRRHENIYTVFRYIMMIAASGFGMLTSFLDGFITFISTLGHLFFFRYLVQLVTPFLLAKEFARHELKISSSVEEWSAGGDASVKSGVVPEADIRRPFNTLIGSWELYLSSGPLTEDGLNKLLKELVAFRRAQPLDFLNFREILAQYHQIRDLSKRTVVEINGNTSLVRYKRFFVLWAVYADKVRFAMTMFVNLCSLGEYFLPLFDSKFLSVRVEYWMLKSIRAFYGISARYYLISKFALKSIKEIVADHSRIEAEELALGFGKKEGNGFEQRLLMSFKKGDLNIRYPRKHELVGRQKYQRIVNFIVPLVKFPLIVLMASTVLFFPSVAAVSLWGYSVVNASLLVYLIITWTRPLQAWMRWLQEQALFKREMQSLMKGPFAQQGDKLNRYLLNIEHLLYAASYLMVFAYPVVLPFVLLYQFCRLPDGSIEQEYPDTAGDRKDFNTSDAAIPADTQSSGAENLPVLFTAGDALSQGLKGVFASEKSLGGFDGGRFADYAVIHQAKAKILTTQDRPDNPEFLQGRDIEGFSFEIREMSRIESPVNYLNGFFNGY